VTALVAAVVLGVSSAEAVVSPHAAAAAPVKRIDPRDVSTLDTPAGPDRQLAPARPAGDFRPLMGAGAGGAHAGSGFDAKTSKEVGRSEKSVEYTNTDGTRSVVLSQVPVSAGDEQGVWRPVDTRLTEDAGSAKAKPAHHGLRPEFAEHADDAALLTLKQGSTPVSISLQGAQPAPRKIKDSTATYPDVLPDTDLEYLVEPGAIKESITVKRAPAAGTTAGSWVFRMELGGLTPALTDDGVVIRDGHGAAVAALPPIRAWDASGSDKDHHAPAQTNGRYALTRDGNVWLLTVSIDPIWLTDPARVFPVVVDPTYTYGFNNDDMSIAYKSDGYQCTNCGIAVGNSLDGPGGSNAFWRTADRFDYTPLFGKTVVGARLDFLRNVQTGSMLSWPSNLYQATSPLGFNAIGAFLASAPLGDQGSMQSQALTDFIAGRVAAGDNTTWFMVTGAETNNWSYKNMQVNLIVDYGTAPPATSIVAPADGSVLTNLTPTLQVNPVTNPSGDGTLYCFKVATGSDGLSGIVVDSGCLTTPSWTVPAGVLQDGTAYTWRVLTAIQGGITTTTPSWVGHFKVDQRIGDPGPSPVDTEGPVTVNLANGNTHVEDAGPTFPTVGGTAGVNFSYNSQQVEPYGLRASYFNDSTHSGTPDANPVLVRNEPQVNADWGTASVFAPALAQDWFVGRWEGYFQVPATGTYHFAGIHANGAKIWVNGQLVYNNPNTSDVNFALTSANGPVTAIALTAGQRVPIKAELYHSSGPSRMKLWVETNEATNKAVPPQVIPGSWLYTQDLPALSLGWTMSADLDGSGTTYTKAQVLDQSVVLTDATGTKHTWTKKSTGGYQPPLGEDGILAIDGTGRVAVTEGANVYVFNVDGTLSTQSSSVDSRKPAALQNIYSGSPLRLTQIKDPVSGRSHTLYYNTDGTNTCYGGATPPPGSDPTAPSQKLCRIAYWDGTETRIWYSGQTVARIENPGGESTDYGYTSTTGPLIAVRSSLVNDWIAADPANRANRTDILTVLTQDTTPGKPKATNVTLPVPDGRTTTPRPAHSYRYDPPNRQTFVDVAGVTPTIGFSRKVTYDDADRALVTTDASGATVQAAWNVKDQATAAVDAAGRRTTTVYDYADRPVDHYGPAPASCFNGQLPTPACAATVPHSHTNYDEGLQGLSVAYYDNMALAGSPKVYATGTGTPDGSLNTNWGTNAPTTGIPADQWSLRATGEITFPQAGDYTLKLFSDDGSRLWIDDALVVDNWRDQVGTWAQGIYHNDTPGATKRIRVEYYDNIVYAQLELDWIPPGGTQQVVPGQYLRPRYGLPTSSTTDDTSGGATERAPSTHGASSYADASAGIDPVFGLQVSSTADPGGLNLTARSSYEQPGTGYLRKLAAAMPAGNVATTAKRDTTTYYGDTETRANPCDATSPAVNQAGAVKTQTGPTPATGGAVTTESVYDAAGRVVASRIGLEDWSCTTYDTRGRPTKSTYAAFGGQPARTITYDYAVGADPLTTKVTDENGSITTVHDLLGRTVSYTDATGTVTTSTYDQVGRLITNTSTVKGVSSALAYTWDGASRLTDVTLDGRSLATPTYTAAGELQNVAYANGSRLDAIGRNDSGLSTSLTWKTAGSTVVDTVTRSRNNRITDDTVTDNAAVAASYSYTYDTVGRLVAASVPHHQLTYRFDPASGCGPNTAAGLNTNRTAFTNSLNGAPPVTTTYCYDDADRLLSTSGATALSFTYDTHGDTTQVGGGTLGYDATKRHISTTTASGTSITYIRDAGSRLIARTVTGASTPSDNGTTRYAYSSEDDSADFILDAAGSLVQRVLPLPGGVLLTKNYDASQATSWAYPNLHGDILLTADGAATRTGGIYLYDPYGQNIDPVSGAFTDIRIASTAAGGLDYGWLGQNERPVEHLAGQQAIEMGARTYLPILGRFLQVDPVAGGSANDYDYVNADPINSFDLAGTFSWGGFFSSAIKVVTVVATVTSFIPGPIGAVSSFALAGIHAAQGNYGAAAMDLLGAIPGGRLAAHLAEQGLRIAPKLAKAASCAVGNSFAPDTPVVMADGTTKPISDITVGDQVEATDPSTGQTEAEPVEDVIVGQGTKHLVDIGIQSDKPGVLTATANHPMWVEGTGWVDAGDLKAGDPIRGPPGSLTRITSVRDRGQVGGQTVYNLTVATIHTYRVLVAGVDLLVHNGCRTSGIYVLHFNNGEKYVGRSVHIERRLRAHERRWADIAHHEVVKTFAAGTSRRRMQLWEQAHISRVNRAAGGRPGQLRGLRNRRNEIRRRR
jgi:RHS repeat-associated protein